MSDTVHCSTHGENTKAYVCTHLAAGDSHGLGFNRNGPTGDNPFPDAWCDDCEIIRVAADGWNEESQKLADIRLICSVCYNRARIRNTRTASTLDEMADLRWKCHACDEWHTGPILGYGYDEPYYWNPAAQEAESSHLDSDWCSIENRDFFVRGVIEIPILGTDESLCWGVWGSLEKENYDKLREMEDDPRRVELPHMFSWLSSQIEEYPDTLNLKMDLHVQSDDLRPLFALQECDHPLCQEFNNGITPDRVKEIMRNRLREL